MILIHLVEGGDGSGNFGHGGRPGEVGGSSSKSFATVQDFIQYFKDIDEIATARDAIKYTETRMKKDKASLYKDSYKGPVNSEAINNRLALDREFISERKAFIERTKEKIKGKADNTIGYGGWEEKYKQYKEGGQKYQYWEHPDFGEVSVSYSPPYHTQRIAASYTVEFKPKGHVGIPIRRKWSGADSMEKGKDWLYRVTGIKLF